MVPLLAWHIEPLVGEIADARRETKTQQVAERKNVIGETRRFGVMLLNPQIGLMVEQAIENMRRITGIRGDDLGIERSVLVGDVGVKEHARLIAVARLTCPDCSPRPLARKR